jgi:hypothetical protein
MPTTKEKIFYFDKLELHYFGDVPHAPGSRVSSGSIVSDYGLDDRGSILGRGRGFFL